MVNKCPFSPRRGYVDARSEYLYHFHNIQDEEEEDKKSKIIDLPTKSMVASTDTTDPLYFWQLYSLIGHNLVVDIVTDFYQRVFADKDNPWFRDVFLGAAPLRHHINAQVAYWVDAFGGGKCYHGGDYRLQFHHSHNAHEIMNARGAKRWMEHMRASLKSLHDKGQFPSEDPRIFGCIVSFLETKMRTYAMDHRWQFDESDFAVLKEMNNGSTERVDR